MTPELRLVQVTWTDASDPDAHGWMSDDEVDSFAKESVTVTSIGWVKSDTKLYLTLVADAIPNGDGTFTWGRATKIPHGMVTQLLELVPASAIPTPAAS